MSEYLYEVISRYKDRRFVMVEPGGNHGDYLIYKGAANIADEVGISYESIGLDDFEAFSYDDSDVIYVHGSGGFNPWWSGTPMMILSEVALRHEGVLIVGPSTFHNDTTFLEQKVVEPLQRSSLEAAFVFAREAVSHASLSEVLPSHVTLLQDHDTAFNVKASDLAVPERVFPWTLFGIRQDKEAGAVEQPGPFVLWDDPPRSANSFDEWVALHASVERVFTNRLHSSILSWILGKPTTLLPNSYFKNRAVWEYSLRDRGVEWRESLPEYEPSIVAQLPVLNKLVYHRRFQRLVRKYYHRKMLS